MDVVVRRDEPGRIVFDRRLLDPSRGLLGFLLSCGAAYVLQYLVRALLFFGSSATPDEWRQAAAGFAIIFFVFLLLASLAWMTLLRRRTVVLDLTRREVVDVCDDRIHSRRRRHAFDSAVRVEVTRYHHPRSSNVTFPVAIVMREGARVVVSDGPGKAKAREIARLVASTLGVEESAIEP